MAKHKRHNQKDFPTWLGIVLILVVAGLVYYTFFMNKGSGNTTEVTTQVSGDFAQAGGYVDGVWDATTKQCLPPPGRQGMVMAICCTQKNSAGEEVQVSCKDSALNKAQSFWLGSTQYPDNQTIWYGISFRNTGTDNISQAWISNVVTGATDANNIAIAIPGNWSAPWNTLQTLPKVGPVTAGGALVQYGTVGISYPLFAATDARKYSANLVASYTTTAGDTGTSSGTISVTIRKSSFGLAVDVTQQ